MRFYSKEYMEEFKRKTNTDEAYLKKTKGFNAKMLWIVYDDPDGNDIRLLIEYKEGKIVHYDFKKKKAPSDFRTEPWDESISITRIHGSYNTYAKMNKKELSAMGALGAKLYRADGDMVKIMVHLGHMTAAGDLMATVPCTY